MRQKEELASFEGIPLSGLRGLTPSFFTLDLPEQADSKYYLEDEHSQVPQALLRPHGTEEHHFEVQEEPELRYTSETTGLGNNTLPVFPYRHEIVEAVKNNPFTIIVAETGAGKSTQVPQFLLDAGWDKVYLTQPRRAAARNVYDRVRSEVGSVLGGPEGDSLVSYQTAGERDGPEDARVKVVTDGLHLVRELHDIGVEENDVLIIDEVHEWNANIEVLVAWVKQAVVEKPNLRVVIMSATMDAERLANYFSEVTYNVPPIIEVPGRNFHVERAEKPESTVVDEVLQAVENIRFDQTVGENTQNGILAFLPGKREIQDTIDEIRRRLPPHLAKDAAILPLHAKLTAAEQQAAFRSYPGVKIVVATDVAQTSLTIPDIKYVIDSGYQRRMELDSEGVQGLVLHPISQADCDQRAGRAGRVSDGFYILTRLDAKTKHVPYIGRDKYPTAEILRTDIVRNTLRVAGVGLDIAELGLYHPVDGRFIEQAKETLQMLGALDEQGVITAVGKMMNQYPVQATSARMLVETRQYPETVRAYMAAITASKEVGGLPYFAYNAGKRWKDLTEETSSDLLAQLDIFIAIQDMTETQLKSYDLDLNNVERAREQFRKIAKLSGATAGTLLPPTEQEREDLRQCMYAGLVTSIYRFNGAGTYTRVGKADTPREISSRSTVDGTPQLVVGDAYRVEYVKGGERITKHIIENVTAATLSGIGRVAAGLSEWATDGYNMRGGKYVEVRRQHLFGMDLGVTIEVPAEPSPRLRETIIAHAIEHAGPQLARLRAIKKEIEELAHLAKDPIPRMTHDQIIGLIHEAAPADITDPSVVDNNLRLLMVERGISLDAFVSEKRRDRILRNAPSHIEAGDLSLDVMYRNSRPFVRQQDWRTKDLSGLRDEVFLKDGRQVYFMFGNKKCSLLELQGRLLAAA